MINYCDLPKYNTKEWLSLDSFKGEEWRDIEGFEGLYVISNYGRIKSIQRNIIRRNGSIAPIRERILKYKKSRGYDSVDLHKDGKISHFRVARLVSMTYIDNPFCLPQVNHKDCNVHNNMVSNLEWCTAKYNNNYADHNKKLSETRKRLAAMDGFKQKLSNTAKRIWKNPSNSMMANLRRMSVMNKKRVAQYTLDGKLVKTFDSLVDAYRATGIWSQNIGRVCRGLSESTHGYKWSYI